MQTSLINCVDKSERKILKTWIVEVEGRMTVASSTYTITQLRGTHTVHKFTYKNIFNEEMTLCFLSSRPNLLEVVGVDSQSAIKFGPMETKEIEVTFPSVTTKKAGDEIKLYIYDALGGERISDTLEFKINYEGPVI